MGINEPAASKFVSPKQFVTQFTKTFLQLSLGGDFYSKRRELSNPP
jgi:hypothetical protein